MHRRGGKKGGKKGGQKRELDEDKVHDCAYNGKEAPLGTCMPLNSGFLD
jgi:hypothetical protein